MKNYLLVLFFFTLITTNAQVAINNNGANPDSSAVLDIQSSNRGFLVSRMSTLQRDAISNPAEGLMIYNTTTHMLELFNGNNWSSVTGDDNGNSDELPVVSTGSITSITAVSAVAMGEITDLGGDSVIRYGHCWSRYPNPTVHFEITDLGVTNAVGAFTSNLTGLEISTTYYIKAYAESSNGVSYGEEVAFTTETSSGNTACPGTPTVTYGGKVYNTIMIGSQCWMKENLNIGTMIAFNVGQSNNGTIEKFCAYDDTARCAVYGGLYQWDELMQYVTTEGVQGICPSGWHIPSDAEWSTLISNAGDGGDLKEAGLEHWFAPNTGATNASGFTALPSGYYTVGSLFGYRDTGIFWSSTQTSSTKAWDNDVKYSVTTINHAGRPKSYAFSVRCVKND
jgi:uncharacterized protein (TIGR02145 family)